MYITTYKHNISADPAKVAKGGGDGAFGAVGVRASWRLSKLPFAISVVLTSLLEEIDGVRRWRRVLFCGFEAVIDLSCRTRLLSTAFRQGL